MRRALTIVATATLGGGLLLFGAATPASAEPDTRFGSCREMRKVDPNGVALTKRAATRAVKQGFRAPLLCPVAYDANRRLDTDRDGVACERRR
jgi:Excalibur calcium-binding domain